MLIALTQREQQVGYCWSAAAISGRRPRRKKTPIEYWTRCSYFTLPSNLAVFHTLGPLGDQKCRGSKMVQFWRRLERKELGEEKEEAPLANFNSIKLRELRVTNATQCQSGCSSRFDFRQEAIVVVVAQRRPQENRTESNGSANENGASVQEKRESEKQQTTKLCPFLSLSLSHSLSTAS